jgi:hypothetical protein
MYGEAHAEVNAYKSGKEYVSDKAGSKIIKPIGDKLSQAEGRTKGYYRVAGAIQGFGEGIQNQTAKRKGMEEFFKDYSGKRK